MLYVPSRRNRRIGHDAPETSRGLEDGSISVGGPLGEKDDSVLIELPREAPTGAWRIWVTGNQLQEEVEERMRA